MEDELPHELLPAYNTERPNKSVPVWTGRVGIRTPGGTQRGDGRVTMRWLPSPRLSYAMDSPELPTGNPPPFGRLLTLWGANMSADAHIGNWTLSVRDGYYRGLSVDGVLAGEAQVGPRTGLRDVTFHLVNFPDYVGAVVRTTEGGWRTARTTWNQGEWRVTIDNLAQTKRLWEELRIDGGYAITHVGRIERRDGASFASRARRELERLGVALSFAKGGWTFSVLPGPRRQGGPSWEDWSARELSRATPPLVVAAPTTVWWTRGLHPRLRCEARRPEVERSASACYDVLRRCEPNDSSRDGDRRSAVRSRVAGVGSSRPGPRTGDSSGLLRSDRLERSATNSGVAHRCVHSRHHATRHGSVGDHAWSISTRRRSRTNYLCPEPDCPPSAKGGSGMYRLTGSERGDDAQPVLPRTRFSVPRGLSGPVREPRPWDHTGDAVAVRRVKATAGPVSGSKPGECGIGC